MLSIHDPFQVTTFAPNLPLYHIPNRMRCFLLPKPDGFLGLIPIFRQLSQHMHMMSIHGKDEKLIILLPSFFDDRKTNLGELVIGNNDFRLGFRSSELQ